jgi:hypothetical protein
VSPSLRAQILLVFDVALPAGIAAHIWMKYGVWDVIDTDPPQCKNQYGDTLSCSTSDLPVMVVALAVFSALTFGALWIQRRRGWL